MYSPLLLEDWSINVLTFEDWSMHYELGLELGLEPSNTILVNGRGPVDSPCLTLTLTLNQTLILVKGLSPVDNPLVRFSGITKRHYD